MRYLVVVLFCVAALAAEIECTWQPIPPTYQVDCYKIYLSTNVAGPYHSIGERPGTETNFVFDITPGAYFVYVTASNFWGESGPSNTNRTPLPAGNVTGVKLRKP